MNQLQIKIINLTIIVVILILSFWSYVILAIPAAVMPFNVVNSGIDQFLTMLAVFAWFGTGISAIVLLVKKPLVGGILHSCLYGILNSITTFHDVTMVAVLAISIFFVVIQMRWRKIR